MNYRTISEQQTGKALKGWPTLKYHADVFLSVSRQTIKTSVRVADSTNNVEICGPSDPYMSVPIAHCAQQTPTLNTHSITIPLIKSSGNLAY